MIKVTIAFVWDHPKPDADSWRMNAYVWESGGETDSVRTYNVVNNIIREAVDNWVSGGDPDWVMRKTPEEDGMEAYRVFDITLEAVPSGNKKKPYVKIEYKKYPGCPQEVAANLMGVVAMFRRELKPVLVK